MTDGYTNQEQEGQEGTPFIPTPFNACHEFVVIATVVTLCSSSFSILEVISDIPSQR